ncbi:MAG: hypothetical protein ACK5Z2_19490 [Bacteroidota bacterium]|jgi:hypothetical protein
MNFLSVIYDLLKWRADKVQSSSYLRRSGTLRKIENPEEGRSEEPLIPVWLPEHLRPKATDKELDKTD